MKRGIKPQKLIPALMSARRSLILASHYRRLFVSEFARSGEPPPSRQLPVNRKLNGPEAIRPGRFIRMGSSSGHNREIPNILFLFRSPLRKLFYLDTFPSD
jgi:hypothetical protein